MATKEQFDRNFERAPAVGLRIGRTSQDVYKMIQRGELAGICRDGKWFVARSSVKRYLARTRKDATAGSPA